MHLTTFTELDLEIKIQLSFETTFKVFSQGINMFFAYLVDLNCERRTISDCEIQDLCRFIYIFFVQLIV